MAATAHPTPLPSHHSLLPLTLRPSARRRRRALSLLITRCQLSGPDPLRVAFACGGAGGHVYAAIALADELHASSSSSTSSLFLGHPSPSLESAAAASSPYPFAPIPRCLPHALLAAALHLRRFRPHVLVATGGAPSLPACLAALLLGLPFVIQDQDAGPAPATRLLAPLARRVFLGFNAPVRLLPKRKCAVYGNPVRMSIRKCRRISKADAVASFFPRLGGTLGEERVEVLLVLGGTEGSPEINVALLNMYYEMLRERKNRYIIWQTGPEGFCEMESLVRSHRRLLLTPFLHEMDIAYAAADVVVSRAGSMSCTEVLVTGKPSILIPLPTIVDDHQTKNAYIMADVMGAKVITEDELDSSSLRSIIDEVFGDEKLMSDMSQKALSAARPNASTDIIRHICSLIGSLYTT
uniref:Glycosyl transferase family 28 C-terminal domain-containing protein n=1 Tax=Leersia perrieri TaxID=77586 RepID=A0A0D9V1K0_9ORYZ